MSQNKHKTHFINKMIALFHRQSQKYKPISLGEEKYYKAVTLQLFVLTKIPWDLWSSPIKESHVCYGNENNKCLCIYHVYY